MMTSGLKLNFQLDLCQSDKIIVPSLQLTDYQAKLNYLSYHLN